MITFLQKLSKNASLIIIEPLDFMIRRVYYNGYT